MRYPHIEAELNLAYTRGEELAPDDHGGWVAAGIAGHAAAFLEAMVADGVLRAGVDDSGGLVYLLAPPHDHEWCVKAVNLGARYITVECVACQERRTVPNRVQPEVPE